MRFRLVIHLCNSVLIAMMVVCVSAFSLSAQEKLEKMRVGYSAHAGALAPIWITKESGSFRKYGLDVDLVFISGGPTTAAALISGEVQVATVGGPAVVASNLGGSDMVLIGGIVNKFAFQVVTLDVITTPSQLKGKKVGVNRLGASPDVAARYALKHMRINERDVTILALGSQSARLAAMKSGNLDAAIFLPPITNLALKEGMRVLLDMSQLDIDFQITSLGSTQRFLKTKRASSLKFMRAFVDGIHFYKTHRKESMAIIAKYMRTNDMEAVGATYDFFAQTILPKKPYPSLKGVQAILDLMAETRPEAKGVSPERFVNISALKELDKAGFIDRLYQ